MKATIICGDITGFGGDVIVNAANPVMLGGGGVDGAIHRAAGPGLKNACEQVRADAEGVRCPVGQVRPTPGFNLRAPWVFHTAGPIFDLRRAGELRPGEVEPPKFRATAASLAGSQPKFGAVEVDPQEDPTLRQQLRDCYKKSMLLAVAMGLRTIAVPAISCGVYGCTHETCSDVFMKLVSEYPEWPVEFTVFLYPSDSYPIWVAAARKYGIEGF